VKFIRILPAVRMITASLISDNWRRRSTDLHRRYDQLRDKWRPAAGLTLDWWHERSLVAFRYSVSLSIAFGLLLALLPPLIFGFWYDTNDDVFLRFIAEGVFSPDRNLNVFLVFSNIYLGYGLRSLYEIAPTLPWYDVFQTTAIFSASAVSAFAIIRTAPSRLVFTVSTLGIGCLLLSVSVRHQFTLIASCLTGAGFCLLLSAINLPSRGRFQGAILYLIAAACLIVGSLMRFDSFALCIVACVPALVLHSGQPSRSWYLPLLVLVISIAAAAALYKIDRDTYRNDREWAGFLEHNHARTNLTEYLKVTRDGRIPSTFLDRLESTGMSQNDREILSNFFFSNRAIFGPDNLASADLATRDAEVRLPGPKQLLASAFGQVLLDWRYSIAFLLIVLTATVWADVLLPILLCGAAFFLASILATIFKTIPFRVAHGLYYTSVLAAWLAVMAPTRPRWLLRWGGLSRKFGPFTGQGLAIAGLAAAVLFLHDRLSDLEKQAGFLTGIARTYMEDAQRISAPRVVIVGGWMPYELLFRPFESIDLIRKTNFQLTGWIDQTPFQQRSLASQGITDLLHSSCQDERTLILASEPILPMFRRYLGEHYSVFPDFTLDPSSRYLHLFHCKLDR
jgi:hypothetical protein